MHIINKRLTYKNNELHVVTGHVVSRCFSMVNRPKRVLNPIVKCVEHAHQRYATTYMHTRLVATGPVQTRNYGMCDVWYKIFGQDIL